MAGIYIHIPFCKKACHYCNFHFSTSLQYKDDIINALVQEIFLQKNYIATTISTIYIGGGTPSLLSANDIEKILTAVYQHFIIEKNVELTLEANPDDITIKKIIDWKQLGINRLSIGVQSFIDSDLQWMNRVHNAEQAVDCIALAKDNGIPNINIDLIYGTPKLTNSAWLQNLDIAKVLDIQHLSCYALTVEPDTTLDKMIALQKKEAVNPDLAATHFELLMLWASENDYEHYEISNFAKTGYRSKHNSSYWQGTPYLGIGPSAHSYNGHTRQWNINNNSLYIKALANKTIPCEKEELTPTNKLNETIMTKLRLIEGLPMQDIEIDTLLAKAQPFIDNELMVVENNHLRLTNKGKLRADGIAAALFF